MCGVAGFFEKNDSSKYCANYPDILKDMGKAILKRGPDSSGIWYDLNTLIGFSHRRLSILDLSSAGHQPMESYSGNYVLIFNGEIYNHLELRTSIEFETDKKINWKSTSDTETILSAIELWGIDKTLDYCKGMFSIAIWDKNKKELTLARDRVGEKPLYYGIFNGVFIFGSQLKSLQLHPEFIPKLSKNGLAKFLKYGYVPSPLSIYESIYKLPSGSKLSISKDNFKVNIKQYWSAVEKFEESSRNQFKGSFTEAKSKLDALLNNSVMGQMISDVPLGAFLSGGIDSSTIVGIMQKNSSRKINTYSIGFSEKGYNEAVFAKEVSSYYGTSHNELYISERDALEFVPMLTDIYDEPFSDSSQIPTFILSKMTKEKVSVALSGDGGDELFCGYNRYLVSKQHWNFIEKIPMQLRQKFQFLINKINYNTLDSFFDYFGKYGFAKNIEKFNKTITSNSLEEFYSRIVSQYLNLNSLFKNKDGLQNDDFLSLEHLKFNDPTEKLMLYDFCTYLPDDILVKVDRAAMGVSLETRAPFLDHQIVEFSWSLPLEYKYNNGVGKYILRQLLYDYIPQKLVDRKKTGFGIPLDKWLKGELVEWAEELLDANLLKSQNIFNVTLIRKLWNDHKLGYRNNSAILWNILIFQSWYKKNNTTIIFE